MEATIEQKKARYAKFMQVCDALMQLVVAIGRAMQSVMNKKLDFAVQSSCRSYFIPQLRLVLLKIPETFAEKRKCCWSRFKRILLAS